MKSLFEPVPMKPKACQRPRIILPKDVNRGCFMWLYAGILVFWTLVIISIGGVLILIVLPYMIGQQMPLIWRLGGMSIFFAAGLGLGMLFAGLIVKEIIDSGVESGEVKIISSNNSCNKNI